MKRLTLLWISALLALPAAAQQPSSTSRSLECDTGPVNKTYGGTQWQVFSCSDDLSVLIVAAAGNPSYPFYFMLYPYENRYQMHGRGTGRKDATSAAFDELKALGEPDIKRLIELTKAQKKP